MFRLIIAPQFTHGSQQVFALKLMTVTCCQSYWTGKTVGLIGSESNVQPENVNLIQKRWKGERKEGGDKSGRTTQKLVSTRKVSVAGILEEESEIDPDWEQPRVVIVGAGLAGLAAAYKLNESGIKNYVVLEASDRPGGRVMSAWLGDTVVEIGADKLHGASLVNPAYVLAAMENLLGDKAPATVPPPRILTSEGREIEDTQLEEMIFEEIMRGAGNNESNGSLSNYLALRINQELANFPPERRYDAERVLYGLLGILKNEIGADLNEASMCQVGKSKRLPGQAATIPLGMVGILAPFLKVMQGGMVRYNTVVKTIDWCPEATGFPRVVARTTDNEEFKGDYVIVTVPLGVLKRNHDLFNPPLPDDRLEAIDKIGFGRTERVYVEYARPWWGSHAPLRFARSAHETINKDDWTSGLSEITPKAGSSHIVSFNVSGTEALLLDEIVEENIAVDMTKMLRKYTGDPTIPYPVNILRSKWGTNPNFLGSTTFFSSETRQGDLKDLAQPLPPVRSSDTTPSILFAGEATSLKHYGTIHGAIESGTREAERVVQYTKQLKGVPMDNSEAKQDEHRATAEA